MATKAQLLDLVNALRTEVTTLRTQLAATQTPVRGSNPTADALKAACARLTKLYPNRKSFTGAEVRQACSD